MKILAAFTLIVVSMASAEPPRYRPVLARQNQSPGSAPYNPSGWRPAGPSFNTPERSGNQQSYLPPEPRPSYGPPQGPQSSYGPPSNEEPTTEIPTTTEASTEDGSSDDSQAENIKIDPRTGKVKPAAVKAAQPSQPGAYFVLLPKQQTQSQNIVVPVLPIAQESDQLLASFRPIQTQNYVLSVAETPQKTAALVSTVPAPLQFQRIVPFASAFQNQIYTPLSSSLLQIYQ